MNLAYPKSMWLYGWQCVCLYIQKLIGVNHKRWFAVYVCAQIRCTVPIFIWHASTFERATKIPAHWHCLIKLKWTRRFHIFCNRIYRYLLQNNVLFLQHIVDTLNIRVTSRCNILRHASSGEGKHTIYFHMWVDTNECERLALFYLVVFQRQTIGELLNDKNEDEND